MISLTTIVITYYPLDKKAKHSADKYKEWLTNFLSHAENPMVIFTSNFYVPVLRSLRNINTLNATLFVTNFSSALEMPPVKRLHSVFQLQLSDDPERSYHTVDLYAVWCAKSYMLNYTVSLNPFRSKYFIYTDAGAFRDNSHQFKKWPDNKVVSKVFSGDDRLLLSIVYPLPKRLCDNDRLLNGGLDQHEQLIQGGLIGGSATSIRWWSKTYYDMCDIFVKEGRFIGKDQNIMNTIALTNPTRIKVILSFRVSCGDVWFAFGPILANPLEKKALFDANCHANNTDEIIQPLEQICSNIKNLT
jgi:hypothetical protein